MTHRSRFWTAIPLGLVVAALLLAGCTNEDDIGVLAIFAEPTEGDAPLEVEVSVRAGADDSGFTYAWRFGDGSTPDERDPTHTYTEPGEYDVWVEVTASSGTTDETKEKITVTGEAPAAIDGAGDSADASGEQDSASTDGQSQGDGEYETWQAAVNAACAASTSAAEQVQGDPNSPEALAQFVEINNAETEAIAAAGVPAQNTAEAQEWIDLRTEASELFVEMATNPPTTADDPRIAMLDDLATQLDALSQARGLTGCRGE